MAKLLGIRQATKLHKKYEAYFDNGFKVNFGDDRYEDYTINHDDNRKRNYIVRHSSKEYNLWYNNPMSPAALSRWILWQDKDIQEAVNRYNGRF